MKKFGAFVLCTMSIITFAADNSYAQDIGLNGAGGRLGFVDLEGGGSTIFIGGHLNLGEVAPNAYIYPSIEFFRKGGVSVFAFNADGRYYFEVPGEIKPFGGGGLALLTVDSEVRIGLDLLGGADFEVSPDLTAFGKVKFTISEFNVFRLTGGITFDLVQ